MRSIGKFRIVGVVAFGEKSQNFNGLVSIGFGLEFCVALCFRKDTITGQRRQILFE